MQISGSKLKELREIRGISRVELSRESDVPIVTIESWESGKRIPRDVYAIKKICDVLNISIDTLLDENDLDDLINRELNAEAMMNTDIGDYKEARWTFLVELVYNREGLDGILKLLDRFTYNIGIDNAIKIAEDFLDESNQS